MSKNMSKNMNILKEEDKKSYNIKSMQSDTIDDTINDTIDDTVDDTVDKVAEELNTAMNKAKQATEPDIDKEAEIKEPEIKEPEIKEPTCIKEEPRKYLKRKGEKDVKDILVLRVWAKRLLEKYNLFETLKTFSTKEEKVEKLVEAGFDTFETSIIAGVTEGEIKKILNRNKTTGTGSKGSIRNTIKLPEIPTSIYTEAGESGKIRQAIEYVLNKVKEEHPEIESPEETFGFNAHIKKCFAEYDTKFGSKKQETQMASISVIKQRVLLERNALI